jgi:hypothetical protein
VEFARLLLNNMTKYDFWKETFPLLINRSIEEVATRETVYEALGLLEKYTELT